MTHFRTRLWQAVTAWVLYVKSPIRFAGLALSLLYLSVLGFDYVTYGYCLSQCVPESWLGAAVGASAIVGVLGSVVFPKLRSKIGTCRSFSPTFSMEKSFL